LRNLTCDVYRHGICANPRFNHSKFLRYDYGEKYTIRNWKSVLTALKGHRVTFIGDSLTTHIFHDLRCFLSVVDPDFGESCILKQRFVKVKNITGTWQVDENDIIEKANETCT